MDRTALQHKPLLAAIIAAAALPATDANAQQGNATDTEQLRELRERVTALEAAAEPSPLAERLSFSGLIEVEAGYQDAPGGGPTSDIVLATAEFGVQAAITDWIQAGALALYEEDDTPLDIDVGLIRLGNLEKTPFYLQAGQYYLPFGNYNTTLVSDPLTLELGETRESTLQAGYEQHGVHAALFTFNGNTSDGGESRIDQFGAQLGYSQQGISAEIAYLSNLADSDALQEGLPSATLEDYIGGMSLYADYQAGAFTLIGEYVAATESFADSELQFDGVGARPQAAAIEGSYATDLAGWPASLSLGYQQTEEALALGLPATRALTSVSVELHPQASLALEWARDEDYDTDVNGSGEQTDIVTLQLAASF